MERAHRFFNYCEGAGAERVHRFLLFTRGQGPGHHNDRRRLALHDLLSGFDAIHARQVDVHRNDIRRKCLEQSQCFLSAIDCRHVFQTRIAANDVLQRLPHGDRVFHN
jgi:hypothetical protein